MRADSLAYAVLAATMALPASLAHADPPASAPVSRITATLDDLQGLMAAEGIDGWLLYDDDGEDAIAEDLVAPADPHTRRWFYLIPRSGAPTALIAKVEESSFDGVPGRKIPYGSWRDLNAALGKLLAGDSTVAMDYSPLDAIPSLSRVDAGTVELVRSLGPKVVTSGDLVAIAESRWTDSQRLSHYVAAHHLAMLKDEALAYLSDQLRKGSPVTEYDVQQFLLKGYTVRGLESEEPPLVSTGAHTQIPHYDPPATGSAPIRPGDLVMIDLWARVAPGSPGAGDEPDTVYADMTWMAYAGAKVPDDEAQLFAVVRAARDAAVATVTDHFAHGKPLHGYDVDDAARAVVTAAGFGDDFIHRTGHSIDIYVHGDGPNMDDYETRDTRLVQRGMGFSIEPGVYLPGQYGIRSEIDVFVGTAGPEIATPQQSEITPLLP